MRKFLIVSIVILLTLLGYFLFSQKNKSQQAKNPVEKQNQNYIDGRDSSSLNIKSDNDINYPLSRPLERITKKPFGIFITPQNSPVQPEKFSGYHTGTDFEIFPEELDKDVGVKSICPGKIIFKGPVSGYGGVIIESCVFENPVTVIYGHIKAGDNLKAGDQIAMDEKIAILGSDKSPDTGGERKHLHLGIKKGTAIDFKGYVQNQKDLENWLDPEKIIFGK